MDLRRRVLTNLMEDENMGKVIFCRVIGDSISTAITINCSSSSSIVTAHAICGRTTGNTLTGNIISGERTRSYDLLINNNVSGYFNSDVNSGWVSSSNNLSSGFVLTRSGDILTLKQANSSSMNLDVLLIIKEHDYV